MPSIAFQRLGDRMGDIDQLLEAHAARGGRGRGRRWNLAALNRSAVVLCVAHFEGFVEDLFSEGMEFVLGRAPNAATVPMELRLLCMRRHAQSVRNASTERHERALRRLLEEGLRLGHPRRLIRRDDIHLEEIIWEFSNPTPIAVGKLFSHLGLTNALREIRWRNMTPHRVEQWLQDLVERRNDIAHGRMGVRVGRDYVTSRRQFVERLAQMLDIRVALHIESFLGQRPWPA